jgi:hypothetical protein
MSLRALQGIQVTDGVSFVYEFVILSFHDVTLSQWEIGPTLLDVTQSPHIQGSTYPRRFFERFYA